MHRRLLVFCVVVGLALAWGFDLRSQFQHLLRWVGQNGPAGMIAFVGIYVVACVLLIPGSILTLGAGAVFGVTQGFVITSIAATAGATVAFLVSRFLAREWVARRLAKHPGFHAIDRAVRIDGWKVVGLARLSPVLPFNLLNYAFGLTSIPLGQYALASWAGMLPGGFLYVYLGAAAGELAISGNPQASRERSPLEWGLFIGGLLATALLTVWITRIARRSLDASLHHEP